MPATQSMPALGSPAPVFSAHSTQGPLALADYLGQWVVFFSYAGDYSPVCATELMAFAQAKEAFAALDTRLLALALGTNAAHIAWAVNLYRRTAVKIPFPIAADQDGSIARQYGMLGTGSQAGMLRCAYIIDPQGIVRASLSYPVANARHIEEILRLLQALRYSDESGMQTPEGWKTGDPALFQPPQTLEEALVYEAQPDRYCVDWYMGYDRPPLISNGPAGGE